MTQTELQYIIKSGETEKIEFKSSFNKSVIETLVAFSNKWGARIFIGIKDNKEIIKIFDDGIEISNPSKLYGDISFEDLRSEHYAPSHRNRLLVESFYLTGAIEKYGTGINRISDFLNDYPNLIFNIENRSGSIVSMIKDVGKDDTKDDTKERRMELLRIIENNKMMSIDELIGKINVSCSTILRDIEKLKNENKIRRIGGRKSGYWEVLK